MVNLQVISIFLVGNPQTLCVSIIEDVRTYHSTDGSIPNKNITNFQSL